MKGIDQIIAVVLIILISIVGMGIVLEYSSPSVNRLREINLFQESQRVLTEIDNAVKDVSQQGEGAARVLQLSISGGEYLIDTEKDSVVYSMESRAQLIGIGISKSQGSINMYGELNEVLLNISYLSIDVTGGGRFGSGYHTLTIRNNGYNQTTQKQIIGISIVPVLPPTAVTFTSQYNQTETIVLLGTNTTSPNYLNAIDGLTYNVTEVTIPSGNFIYQRRPNSNDLTLNDCTNKQNAYAYDGSVAICDGGGTRDGGYWWNNTGESGGGTINTVKFGVRLRTSGSRSNDNYWIEYGFASTPGSCTSVGSWIQVATNQFPGATLTWYNVTNTTAVTWANINNTCFRFRYQRFGGDDGYIVYIDAFHADVNYSTASTYRMEVEHNATGVSWAGILNNITISLNFTTNVTSSFNLLVYNFNSGIWDASPCDTAFVTANVWYTKWCNITINPDFYYSGNKIRFRLNGTEHNDIALVKEDYIQYYVTYTS
jgi:hypothetical protein